MVSSRRPKANAGAALPPVPPSPSQGFVRHGSNLKLETLSGIAKDFDQTSSSSFSNQFISSAKGPLSSRCNFVATSSSLPAFPDATIVPLDGPRHTSPSTSVSPMSIRSAGTSVGAVIEIQSPSGAMNPAYSQSNAEHGTASSLLSEPAPTVHCRRGRRPTSWTPEEDRRLAQLVAAEAQAPPTMASTKTWSIIASQLASRTGKQCRERWLNQLKPGIKREPWSPEEERVLYEAHARLGNKWVAIAELLPGRTDNCIKNHYNSMLRKQLRRKASVAMLERLDCVESPRRLKPADIACVVDRGSQSVLAKDSSLCSPRASPGSDVMSIDASRSPSPSTPATPTAACSGTSSSSAGFLTPLQHTPRNAKLEISNLMSSIDASDDDARDRLFQQSTPLTIGSRSSVERESNMITPCITTASRINISAREFHESPCFSACETGCQQPNSQSWTAHAHGPLSQPNVEGRTNIQCMQLSTSGASHWSYPMRFSRPAIKHAGSSQMTATPTSSIPSSACPSPSGSQGLPQVPAAISHHSNILGRNGSSTANLFAHEGDMEVDSGPPDPMEVASGSCVKVLPPTVVDAKGEFREASPSSESEGVRTGRGITKRRHHANTTALAALAMAASAVPPSPLTPEQRPSRSRSISPAPGLACGSAKKNHGDELSRPPAPSP